ncbi:MAG: 50S ribosomal protein L2 [Candidatus Helarchaeota archaeon]
MGKRIRVQKRGRGHFPWVATKKGKKGPIKHKKIMSDQKDTVIQGKIIDILHERGRTAPIGYIKYSDKTKGYLIMPEGIIMGQTIEIGKSAEVKPGNTLPLSDIPEGTMVYNIEARPGDGGKFVRASGTFGLIVSRTEDKVIIRLPSKKQRLFNPNCLATIGVVAGGGRPEKPFLKAGNKYHHLKARGHKYPIVRGVAMAAVHHPFGGGVHQHISKSSSTTARNAPPGRKVGLIAARRTGRKKK